MDKYLLDDQFAADVIDCTLKLVEILFHNKSWEVNSQASYFQSGWEAQEGEISTCRVEGEGIGFWKDRSYRRPMTSNDVWRNVTGFDLF
jgi:hypothetical protein